MLSLHVHELEHDGIIALLLIDFELEEYCLFIILNNFTIVLNDILIGLFLFLLDLHFDFELTPEVVASQIAKGDILKVISQFGLVNPKAGLVMFIEVTLYYCQLSVLFLLLPFLNHVGAINQDLLYVAFLVVVQNGVKLWS